MFARELSPVETNHSAQFPMTTFHQSEPSLENFHQSKLLSLSTVSNDNFSPVKTFTWELSPVKTFITQHSFQSELFTSRNLHQLKIWSYRNFANKSTHTHTHRKNTPKNPDTNKNTVRVHYHSFSRSLLRVEHTLQRTLTEEFTPENRRRRPEKILTTSRHHLTVARNPPLLVSRLTTTVNENRGRLW